MDVLSLGKLFGSSRDGCERVSTSYFRGVCAYLARRSGCTCARMGGCAALAGWSPLWRRGGRLFRCLLTIPMLR